MCVIEAVIQFRTNHLRVCARVCGSDADTTQMTAFPAFILASW